MRFLIDASSGVGASGSTRVHELMAELPEHRGDHHFTIAVPRRYRSAAAADPAMEVISPPPSASRPAARIAWQLSALPALAVARRCDAVLGTFNVVAARWPAPAPRVAVMISNLLPFHAELGVSVPSRLFPRLALLRRLTLNAVARADLVLVQSAFAVQALGAALNGRRWVIVAHRPPAPTLADARSLSVRRPYVLVVADRFRYKGVHVVVEALGELASAQRPCLILVGRAVDARYERRLWRTVNRHGLSEDVVSLGPRSRGEVLALMRDAVACVACSHLENLSRIPGEAMAMGAAVICSDIPAHREAAGDGALYYAPSDASGLAEHISELLAQPAYRERLGDRGRRRTVLSDTPPATAAIVSALEHLCS